MALIMLACATGMMQGTAVRPSFPHYFVRRSASAMSEARQEPDEERSGTEPTANSPLDTLDRLADASWDMFVMPGEYANSRYDRLGADTPMSSADTPVSSAASPPNASAFSWGGEGAAQEALRLPTGVKAAENLVPAAVQRPRGLWFEKEGRDIKGDIELLSREWTRLWAVVVVIALLVNVWSALNDRARLEHDGAAAIVSERQERFIQERVNGDAYMTL